MDITIAISPFKSLVVNDPVTQFMQGFSEDLVISLSKFLGLSVISPQSAMHMNEDKAIANLGPDYMVNGSYRSMGNNLRIVIQLIRIRDSKIIFASDYSESAEAMFDMMDRVVKEIVNTIQQYIDFDLLSFSYKKETTQLAAYENYLLGMDRLKKGGAQHDLEARKYFDAALEIDPLYAKAYTGLSLSYFNVWSCQLWDRWDVAQKGAQKFALKALEIDEND